MRVAKPVPRSFEHHHQGHVFLCSQLGHPVAFRSAGIADGPRQDRVILDHSKGRLLLDRAEGGNQPVSRGWILGGLGEVCSERPDLVKPATIEERFHPFARGQLSRLAMPVEALVVVCL